jgi:hypothetical protein
MATSDQPPEGGDTERCKRCDGTGEVLFIGEAWTGPHRSKMGPCPDCDGTGTKPAPRGAEQERGCTCTPKPDGQAPDMPAPDCPEHGAEGDEWERERCQSCGRPYERVWAATNALWNAVVGGSAGLRCPECFDREARADGFSPYWAVADGHFLIPENRRAEGDEEPCQPPGAEPPTCPSCGRWRAWARPVNISESADVCDDPFHDAPVLAEDLRRDWRVYLTRAETAEQKATELAGEAERYREALERIAAATGTSTESHHIAQAALAEGSRKEVTPGQRNRRPEVSE